MEKIIAKNRKASHDYYLEERVEAGIELVGTEIKSIRKGSVQLRDAYVDFVDGEAYVKEMTIAPYEFGNRFNHEDRRDRKLLLHKQEIRKLSQKVKEKGYTVVPTMIYLKNGKAKLEIALAKGKALYDKRQSLKQKDAQREIDKEMKNIKR
jgi:SsrA-binding protein